MRVSRILYSIREFEFHDLAITTLGCISVFA